MSFERYNTAAQRTVGTSSSLAGALGQVRNPLTQLNSQINTTAATLPKMASAQQQAAAASKQNAQAMQNQIQRMTALGSRIGGIAFMFTGLTAAMGEAQGMSELLAESEKKLAAEQERAAEAIRRHGENSFQATRALEAVEKAERAVAFQSRITTLSIQDQFFFIGGLASIALPSVIQAFGKLRTAMKNAQAAGQGFTTVLSTGFANLGTRFTGVLNAMITGLNALVPAQIRVGTAMNVSAANTARNTTALSTYTVATGAATAANRTFGQSLMLLVRHPVVLTIAALASAYVVLQQNVGGVTDSIRDFGKSLGEAFPILQPLLDLIEGIAASMGIMGDETIDAGQKFAAAAEGFADLSTLWHDTLANMQRSENEIVRLFGNIGVRISDAFVGAGNAIQEFVSQLPQAFASFPEIPANIGRAFGELTALIARDLGEISNTITTALASIPTNIGSAFAELGAKIGEGLSSIPSFIQTHIIAPITNIPDQIQNVGQAIWNSIIAFPDTIANWVKINIVAPITAFPEQLGDLGQKVFETFGSITEKMGTWAKENIVDPILGVLGQISEGLTNLFTGGSAPEIEVPPGFGGVKPGPAPVPPVNLTPMTPQEKKELADQILREFQGTQGQSPQGIAPSGTGGGAPVGDLLQQTLNPVELARQFNAETRLLTPSSETPFAITPTAPAAGFENLRQGIMETVKAMDPFKAAALESDEHLKALDESAGNLWNRLDAGSLTTEQLEDRLKRLVEANIITEAEADKVKEKYNEYTKSLQGTGAAAEDHVTVIESLNNANNELRTKLSETGQAAVDGSLAFQMQRQGIMEAQQAALDYGSALEQSTAFNQEWGRIIETSAFQAAAFETGVQKQVEALNKQKVELAENAGLISEYTRQVQSGEAGQVAFARGVQEQQKALLDSKVALEETRGQLETYAQQLASGEQQAVAFAEGQQAVQQSFLDMIRSVSEIQGQISEYDRLLADGTAQTVAFAQGMAQGQLAAREFQVEIAAANGESQGFREGLVTLNPELQNLSEFANMSTDSLAQMVAVMRGGRDEVTEFAQSILEIGGGLSEMIGNVDFGDFAKDIDDNVEDIEDQFEELADELDLDEDNSFIIGMRTKVEREAIAKDLQQITPLMIESITSGGPEVQQKVKDYITSTVEEATEDATPETQLAFAKIPALLQTVFDTPPDTSKFDIALKNLTDAMTQAGLPAEQVNELIALIGVTSGETAPKLGTLAERIVEVSGSVDSLIAQRPELEKYASSLESIALNAPGTFKAAFPGQETGMEGADVGPIPPEFGTQPQQIDTSEATKKLQDLQQLAAATRERVKIELEKLGPITQQVVGQMNLAFTSIQQTWPQIMTSTVQAVNAQFTQLIADTTVAIGQMNQAFVQGTNQMITALQAVGNMAQQVGTQVQTAITNAINAAAQAVNSATNTMITALQGVQNMVTQTAQAFPQIGDAANQAASVVNSATNTMITALQGVISMAEQVAESILAIGQAANQAQSDVEALSTAISNIPDGEAVIRVTWDVAPAPSGVSGFGVGLGFQRSGTVTYTAGGGTGGGPGFGGGITPAGGGPGEPTLQFGAQHGLGQFGGKDSVKAFNELGILSPVMIDHPTKMLVGENGPELVSVTPVNRNRSLRSGELSPFVQKRSSRPVASFAHGLGEAGEGIVGGGPGFGGTINIGSGTVVFRENQGPVTINNIQGGGTGTTGVGIPTTGGGGRLQTTTTDGTFNVPGGQGQISGNGMVCINGQCFGNPAAMGPTFESQLGQPPQAQPFEPVRDEQGMIKAIETLVEWFKHLGLPLGGIGGAGLTAEQIVEGLGVRGTPGAFAQAGGSFGQIQMTGGQIVFQQNQGQMDLQTSTGTIAIAGRGGAFAQAGGATATAGFAGAQFVPSPTEQAQLRQFESLNNNLTNISNMLGETNQEFTQFQQSQQETLFGPQGIFNQPQGGFGGGGTVFGTGQGQVFRSGNFTGFGQSFQQFPGGGAVGSGTNDPLGFLNQQLGSFGIPTPAGIPTSGTGGGTGGVTAPGGVGGTGGCINLCQGSINSLGGGTIGGGPATGGGVPAPSQTFGGGPGEPTFIGGGGNVNNPVGNTPGQFTTGGGASSNPDNWQVMRIEGEWYVVDSAQSNALVQNTPFQSEQDAQNFIDVARAQQNPPQQFPNVPAGGQPTFGQPTFGGGNQVSISTNQFPTGGFGTPGIGGTTGPIGNPPVPPRIVQQAGLPSQAPSVNQDPTTWRIVESAGLVGTYDIIDDRGNVVQLGFRTIGDAETYLNYFISYYEWVRSGSTGIPGPAPIPGGIGGGVGGGFPVGGTGNVNLGGGITATAGNAQASAGGGGAFAQAGNALAVAGGGGTGGTSKFIGPTPVPDMPFEPIPRAQGPFRSGQDNQEPIFDNSGIKIGADFGGPGDTVTMEDVTEGGGRNRKGSRLSDRIRARLATARARASGNAEAIAIIDAAMARIETMLGNLVINLQLNNMIDGNMVNRSLSKFQVKKVSVFS